MEAVKLITAQQPKALDIAAGALIEARDMLGKGFTAPGPLILYGNACTAVYIARKV